MVRFPLTDFRNSSLDVRDLIAATVLNLRQVSLQQTVRAATHFWVRKECVFAENWTRQTFCDFFSGLV